MALTLIHNLAEISLSMMKDVIASYSASVGALCFINDTFFADREASAEGQPKVHASIAKGVEEFNSDDSVADMIDGRAWEAGEKLLLWGKALAGKKILVGGRTLFPDNLDWGLGILTEFKSTQNLRFSKQLKDYMRFCREEGLRACLKSQKSPEK
jgi:hypothetical protein